MTKPSASPSFKARAPELPLLVKGVSRLPLLSANAWLPAAVNGKNSAGYDIFWRAARRFSQCSIEKPEIVVPAASEVPGFLSLEGSFCRVFCGRSRSEDYESPEFELRMLFLADLCPVFQACQFLARFESGHLSICNHGRN